MKWLNCTFLNKSNPQETCPSQRNDPNLHGFCIIFVVFAKVLVIAVCLLKIADRLVFGDPRGSIWDVYGDLSGLFI